jgi:hypothetical protein
MSEEPETVIRAAQHAIIHGGKFLEILPKIVLKIGKNRLWTSIEPRGRGPFKMFRDFAEHPLPDGLGCTMSRLIAFCKGHDKAVEFLKVHGGREQALEVQQGQRTDLALLSNRKKFQGGGTGSEYLLRRLAKTAPDILDRYEAGEFKSVHAASIAAGHIKVATVLQRLLKLWEKATEAERRKFRQAV